MSRLFSQSASYVARYAGRPGTFLPSALIIVAWAFTGPLFNYSDTWQLIINTGDNYCYIPYGLHHSEHAEPGRCCNSSQA
jgi:hypothetical protein